MAKPFINYSIFSFEDLNTGYWKYEYSKKEEDPEMTRPWKVYDFWDNIKVASFGSFQAAAKAAFELRLKHHDEVMPRISHKSLEGFAYVDKDGLIKTTHEKDWEHFIGKDGYKVNVGYIDISEIKV